MKKSKKVMNDSVCAIKGVKVSSAKSHLDSAVTCYIYTRSGKLAQYNLIIEDEEVKIMSKKKVKSTIPLQNCHAKIVQKIVREPDQCEEKIVEGQAAAN